MMSWVLRHLIVIQISVLLVVMTGCAASSPTRFYVLRPSTEGVASKPSEGPEAGCISIGVGPIKVADYLDRPEVVTRVASNEIKVTEFEQWAEPLGQNISRVLAENLSTLLCTTVVVTFPWSLSAPIDYQVEVHVIRLDGHLGGDSTLEARWMAFRSGRPKKLVASKKVVFTESTDGRDYRALVASESRALEVLSRDIAEALKTSLR